MVRSPMGKRFLDSSSTHEKGDFTMKLIESSWNCLFLAAPLKRPRTLTERYFWMETHRTFSLDRVPLHVFWKMSVLLNPREGIFGWGTLGPFPRIGSIFPSYFLHTFRLRLFHSKSLLQSLFIIIIIMISSIYRKRSFALYIAHYVNSISIDWYKIFRLPTWVRRFCAVPPW